jgi:hypothetical protein
MTNALFLIFGGYKRTNMKRLVLVAFLMIGLVSLANAQNLAFESVDEMVEVNSTAVGDYAGYAIIKNTSTTDTIDVFCKRQFFGSNWCAFDSAYFCWDLCYPSNIGQSFGSISLNPGQDTNAFSGHVYSTNTGVNCVDSVRYTFYNARDVNDSLSVVIKYAASTTFRLEENTVAIKNIYPNPATQFVFIEIEEHERDGLTVDLYNLLGSKVRSEVVTSNRVRLNVADLHAGIYLCTVSKRGTAIETQKIVVKH